MSLIYQQSTQYLETSVNHKVVQKHAKSPTYYNRCIFGIFFQNTQKLLVKLNFLFVQK